MENKEANKWCRVLGHQSEIMPTEDCVVWVTRATCFNQVWVQTIYYYSDEGKFTLDGIRAWMPYQREKPKPYNL